MTPYTHTNIETHVDVYQQDVRAAIDRSRTYPSALYSLRRYVARGLVRSGAWLLPDKTEVIEGSVFNLPGASAGTVGRKAA